MEQISLELFGTKDYRSILDAMAPSDALVKEFWQRCVINGFCDKK